MAAGDTGAVRLRRALWLVPLVAILALLYLWFFGSEPDPLAPPEEEHATASDGDPTFRSPRSEPAGEVELRGRPGATPAERRDVAPPRNAMWRQWAKAHVDRHAWKGSVRSADGRAIAGAAVHQVRKAHLSRAWSAGGARATTDAEGRLVLAGYLPSETLFVVTARGYVSLFLEGSEVRVDQELALVLEAARKLRVRLVDEQGEPVDFGGVKVVRLGRGDRPDLGSSAHLLPSTQYEMTNAEGIADFHFDTLDPVMVIPEIEGFSAEPAEQWLPEPSGSVTFTVRAGTLLVVNAKQADGSPVRGPVWVVVYERGSGRELTTFRSAGTDHVADMDLELPVGSYAVEVTVEGREPVLIPSVELPGGGARVERTVTMAGLGDMAVLSIEAALDRKHEPEDGGPRHHALAPPRMLVRRLDGGWEALGWRLYGDFRWIRAQRAREVRLRPGTYDVVLSFPSQDQVAVLEGVTLLPGSRITRRATVRPGVTVRLYDLLPPDLPVRTIRLESSRYGTLPVVGRFLGATLQDAGGLVDVVEPAGSRSRSKPETGPWLGPYPCPFALVVEDWRGAIHRFAATR